MKKIVSILLLISCATVFTAERAYMQQLLKDQAWNQIINGADPYTVIKSLESTSPKLAHEFAKEYNATLVSGVREQKAQARGTNRNLMQAFNEEQ